MSSFNRVSVVLGAVATVALVALGAVSAAPQRGLAGDLDPSFGKGGVVTFNTGKKEEYAYVGGIVVQPDKKIVVAGGAVPGNHGLILARYMPNGTLDPTFGKNGVVETPIKYWAFADSVALQPDGKIVIAGRSYQGNESVLSAFTLARYNPNGSLDSSFGDRGITTTGFPDESGNYGDAGAYSLAILPDGKILAGGAAHWTDGAEFDWSSFALARYDANGSLDQTFGTEGRVETRFFCQDRLAGIAVQPDGKIVAGGSGGGCGHQEIETIALARYEPDGSLDSTFGGDGKVTTSPDQYFDGEAIALQRTGKIVVAGWHSTKGKSWPLIARYGSNGGLDRSFGDEGTRLLKRSEGAASAVALQRDGRILMTEMIPRPGHRNAVLLARLEPNGLRDPSFGTRGLTITQLQPGGSSSTVYRLLQQADGSILAGGRSFGTDTASWVLARFLGGNNCVAPALRGKSLTKAKAAIRRAHCRTGRVARRFSRKVGEGRVISQSPKRGTRLPASAKVNLVVSKGKRR